MKIAIIGAGPAGAHLAFLLSARGADVYLFDAREAWEKPCGGGVTSKALHEFDFLNTPDAKKQMVSQLRLITAQERELTVQPSQAFAIYSHAEMGRLEYKPVIIADSFTSVFTFRLNDGTGKYDKC